MIPLPNSGPTCLVVHPDRLLRNSTARAGDALILTKPLGVGVLSAALKQERLDAAGYAALIAVTTQLNRVGADLAGRASAVTDVTGFGLIGHTLEMARAAGLTAEIFMDAVPSRARRTRRWPSLAEPARRKARWSDGSWTGRRALRSSMEVIDDGRGDS